MNNNSREQFLRRIGILPSRYSNRRSVPMRPDVPADIERLMGMHSEVVGKLPPHMVREMLSNSI